jgi:hypothetical protein
VAALIVPALVLFVAIAWRQPILYSPIAGSPNSVLNWVAIWWLALLPALVLLGQVFLYGMMRALTLALLIPLFAVLATLGLINAGLVDWQKGGGLVGNILLFLDGHSGAIWTGVAAALLVGIPFRALGREVEIYLRVLGTEFEIWNRRRQMDRGGSGSASSSGSPTSTVASD